MAPNFQPFEVADFSGGRTDNYMAGPINRFRAADNLVIVKHGSIGKLLTRFGSQIYNSSFPLVNPAAERIGTIRNFRTTSGDKVLVHSNKKIYQLLGGGWTPVVGPTANQIFPAGTTVDNVTSYAEWNDHIFITNDAFAPVSKLYNDGSNVLKLRTAGLPALASSPTVTATAATGKNYLYRFVHKYTYAVGTVTFIDRGPVTEVSVTNSDSPNVNQNNIAVIPTLANGATYNWDTTVIKIEIYRTVNNGSTFYRIGEVTNGTAVFTDNISDATIQANNVLLYTEGGVVENDLPPLSKLVHVTGDIAYYAHIKDSTGQIFSNRLVQAIPGDPDSVPGDFSVDVQDSIVGLSSVKGLPILLCKNSVYRVDGQFDELGRGGMVAQKINDSATCVSSQSVVQTIEGVFWAGEDSYYFTDGYQVLKLCKDWLDSYRAAVQTTAQKNRIQGKYDSRTRRILWTTQQDSGGSSDCNLLDILHLDWGTKEDAAFTTASGGAEFAPTAIEFVDGDMLRGHVNGFLLRHNDTLVTDPKVDILVTPANWPKKTIIWGYQSCAFNFGTSYVRKYTPNIILTARNKSNISIQLTSVNDDGKKIENLKPIRFRGNIVWGDATIVWGDSTIIWSFDGLIEDQRRFPANSLRCSYKQISMTNANVTVITSDSLGTCSINSTTKVATLTSATVSDWPVDSVDYTIAFQDDNYSREYIVSARTADTITYLDTANNSATASGQKWILKGYPKGEILNLISYTISYILMGQTQKFFTAPEAGDVSA